MTSRLSLVALAMLAGCALEESPREVQILVPEDVEVDWDVSFDGLDDGLAALVPVDVMVYRGQSGEPVAGVPLLLRGVGVGVSLLPVSAVLSANVDDLAPVWWDAWRDRYVTVDAGVGADGPRRALVTHTDETGLAQVYVFIDRFEGSSEGARPAVVTVTGSALEESFVLRPR